MTVSDNAKIILPYLWRWFGDITRSWRHFLIVDPMTPTYCIVYVANYYLGVFSCGL